MLRNNCGSKGLTFPKLRGAGLSEYGSGEARIESVALLGPGDEERSQFMPGERLAVRLRIVSTQPIEPPLLSWELHDEAGLVLATGSQDTAELGWHPADPELGLRFDVDSLPLADGRFRLRFELADAARRRLYHWLDDAARFVVYPADGAAGIVRLDGRWSVDDLDAGARIDGG